MSDPTLVQLYAGISVMTGLRYLMSIFGTV
jgi:hypothetical protein